MLFYTLTVLKDLYILKLFIFTLYFHNTVRENEPQKVGANCKKQSKKKKLLENKFPSMGTVCLCTKTKK